MTACSPLLGVLFYFVKQTKKQEGNYCTYRELSVTKVAMTRMTEPLASQGGRLHTKVVALFFCLSLLHSRCDAFLVGPHQGLSSARIPTSATSPANPTAVTHRWAKENDNNDDTGSNANDSNNNDSDNNNNSQMNIEEERKRLESLLGMSQDSSSISSTTVDDTNNSSSSDLLSLPLKEWKRDLPKVPPLTSIGRERLEMEITLLEGLGDSDDAIPQLWDLWYTSRGPKAAAELMATERLVAQGQPEAWKEAEDLLRDLIAREGIHWVEPVNRLATLLFLQNRYEDSLELCLLVLAIKPWHFGALSGIVLVYQGLQDNENMMAYSQQRMPPLPKTKEEALKMEEQALKGGGSETRQTWVYRMADKAKAALLKSEMGLEESFQDLDTKGSEVSGTRQDNSGTPPEDEENAWQ